MDGLRAPKICLRCKTPITGLSHGVCLISCPQSYRYFCEECTQLRPGLCEKIMGLDSAFSNHGRYYQ